MLQLIDVSISFAGQAVLDRVSFVVNPGDRIGVIGPNGCGKSTLLRIMAGQISPSVGEVRIRRGTSVGMLEQSPDTGSLDRTLAEEMLNAVPRLVDARDNVERLAGVMADATGDALAKATDSYGVAAMEFETLGGYRIDDRVTALLHGLGLGSVDRNASVATLSGGQRTRLGLARLLLAAPDVLLLDEPTSHLDLDALEWLERFVGGYRGAVVVVSHDREFLDTAVSQILAIDPETRQLTACQGNYSAYLEQAARAAERRAALFRVQQATIRRMEEDISRRKQYARKTETGTNNDVARRLAKKVAKQAKARERKLERFKSGGDIVERPEDSWGMKLEFAEAARGGQRVVELVDAGHAYGEHPVFARVDLDLQYGERVALLGSNGCGKSTLLRAIAGELVPTNGEIRTGAGVRIGFLRQEAPGIDPQVDALTAVRRVAELDETAARNYLHFFLFAGESVFVPFGQLSLGERQRLQLALLVAAGANCLLMDEPANHLDIESRERLEHALARFPGAVLVATHDRSFIDRWSTAVWGFVRAGDGPPTVRKFVDRDDMRRATVPADRRRSP
ncbi:MAG: ABC-F family ATP-binding cassette domain-containing protein [Chloroflexi bacterium]|nr:ABC-F family ATP-binding cassette domain-containing protein [Chloroflexota bacterium]